MRVLALDYGSARCGCAMSDPTGTIAEGNIDGGILIGFSQIANNNTIGGLTPAARNVISGNGAVGIHVESIN